MSSYVIIEIPFYLGVKGRRRKKRPDDINWVLTQTQLEENEEERRKTRWEWKWEEVKTTKTKNTC